MGAGVACKYRSPSLQPTTATTIAPTVKQPAFNKASSLELGSSFASVKTRTAKASDSEMNQGNIANGMIAKRLVKEDLNRHAKHNPLSNRNNVFNGQLNALGDPPKYCESIELFRKGRNIAYRTKLTSHTTTRLSSAANSFDRTTCALGMGIDCNQWMVR